jgi:hypothetical protein
VIKPGTFLQYTPMTARKARDEHGRMRTVLVEVDGRRVPLFDKGEPRVLRVTEVLEGSVRCVDRDGAAVVLDTAAAEALPVLPAPEEKTETRLDGQPGKKKAASPTRWPETRPEGAES